MRRTRCRTGIEVVGLGSVAEMTAPILVLTGPSGVGKTTTALLVAKRFDASVHLPMDSFTSFFVNGWIEPWLPEAARQNHILGGAVLAAAMNFAAGGYTVVLDGHVFPDALAPMSWACRQRGIVLHYAVLRVDFDECVRRAAERQAREPGDLQSFARLHERFAELGPHEANVIDAADPPERVASSLLASFAAGRLVVPAFAEHAR